MGRWFFEQLRGGPRRTPQEAELFKDKDAEEGEYPGNDYLVREVVQNALDAKSATTNGPVRVRLSLHDANEAPSRKRLTHYFSRLRAPLKSFDIQVDSAGLPELTPRFLVCEDFGTRGLEGDEQRFSDPDPDDDSDQDFYWFWRNIGRSAKTGDDLGRWGLGKTVHRAVSIVRCMLGLTVRESDGQSLLMGQGVLQPHSYSGVEYHPEGYWCAEGDDGLAQPIVEREELEQFRSEWHITRSREPGLSVVSPYVPDELRAEPILQAVVVNFFVLILRERLVVEVHGPELGTKVLDAKSIDKACACLTWNGGKRKKLHTPPPLDFVRRCLATPPVDETKLIGTERAPGFTEGALGERDLHRLQRDLASGRLVALRVRLALPRRGRPPEEGRVDVYLQHASDGERADSYYVREGMTITKRSSRAELHGVRSFVNVASGPMAKLLGDTEGAAHEDWELSADRPNREWKSWKNRVRFTRTIVDSLVEYLTPKQVEPDFNLLAEFFSIEEIHGPQRDRMLGDEDEGAGQFPEVVASPKWFQISERAGGFTVSRNSAVPVPAEPLLEVTAAYDLPRGNPLKHWSNLDFVFTRHGKLRIKWAGLKPRLLEENVAQLDIRGDTFSFSVDGFDVHRDLYVRVDDKSGYETNGEGE